MKERINGQVQIQAKFFSAIQERKEVCPDNTNFEKLHMVVCMMKFI